MGEAGALTTEMADTLLERGIYGVYVVPDTGGVAEECVAVAAVGLAGLEGAANVLGVGGGDSKGWWESPGDEGTEIEPLLVGTVSG